MEDGIVRYEHNLFSLQRTKIRSRRSCPPGGKVKIEIEKAYVVPRPAGALKVTMTVNAKAVAEGTCVARTNTG